MNNFQDNQEVTGHYSRLAHACLNDEEGDCWAAFMVSYDEARLFPELVRHLGQYFVLFIDGASDIMPYRQLESLPMWDHGKSKLRRRQSADA